MQYILYAIIVLVLIIIVRNIRVVQQSKAYVVERLGAYKVTWGTGILVIKDWAVAICSVLLQQSNIVQVTVLIEKQCVDLKQQGQVLGEVRKLRDFSSFLCQPCNALLIAAETLQRRHQRFVQDTLIEMTERNNGLIWQQKVPAGASVPVAAMHMQSFHLIPHKVKRKI